MNGETSVPRPPDLASAAGHPLHDALLDSRQRWQDLVAAAADLAFETDAAGRLTFVWPDPVLGWAAEALIGRPAEALLAPSPSRFNPFRPDAPLRRHRAWLRRQDGAQCCLSFSVIPVRDAEGRITGARGIALDTTETDGQDRAVAAALRRGEVIDHILWQMRQEVLAPRMMQAVLGSLMNAVGAEGAAVVDSLREDPQAALLHQAGLGVDAALSACLDLLRGATDAPVAGVTAEQRPILTCPSYTRFGERIGLALWRPAGGRPWDAEEQMLASSAAGIVRVVLEHESIQREMARQARTDPLTGLMNRRAFLDEMSKRISRLDREGLPGTVMFVDLDNFKLLNDRCGHEVGDAALKIAADLLRRTVRPADLVARLGGDEFALWLDGADPFTAAERAEGLRVHGPQELGAALPEGADMTLSMSIGIAGRAARSGEDEDSLLRRADLAMYEVKRAGRGHWLVSQDPPI